MKEALLPISDASPQASPCSGRRRVRCLVRCTALGALVLLGLAMMHHCGGGNNNGGEPVLNRLQDLLGGRNGGGSSDTCEVYLGRHKVERFSVILTADPGDFSGVSEAHHIIRNLQKRKLKPRDETVCAEHYRGTLMGQDVLVVTTGIGPTAAGLCTLEIVLACGDYIDQLIYFGTSGWSPQYGGVLNPPNCTAANDNSRISRMGDICISPFTVNWSCKKTTWDMQASGFPNQCVRPREFAGPNATILYGECMFVEDNRRANLALSRDLAAATRTALGAKNFPQRNSLVLEHEGLYWQYMAEGTKQTYPNIDNTELPYIWDHTQCVEVDAQFFYSGVPFELAARDYAAATINTALRLKGAEAKSASDVIAVSAMEGIGVSEAMERYHGLHTTENFIPYTNVRTISNWLHQPVHQTQPGVWDIYKQVEEDYVNGYAYAIATGSSVIMTYFQQACLEDYGLLEEGSRAMQMQQGEQQQADEAALLGGKRHSGLPAECTFQIDYD